MRRQIDQAFACMWLAVCISLAVFLSVFGKSNRVAIEDARALLTLNQQQQDDVETALRNNQRALSDAEAALANFGNPTH